MNHSLRAFWTPQTFNPLTVSAEVTTAYKTILPYVTEFLCAEHPYRKGAVCPFVPKSLKDGNIFFTSCISSTE